MYPLPPTSLNFNVMLYLFKIPSLKKQIHIGYTANAPAKPWSAPVMNSLCVNHMRGLVIAAFYVCNPKHYLVLLCRFLTFIRVVSYCMPFCNVLFSPLFLLYLIFLLKVLSILIHVMRMYPFRLLYDRATVGPFLC